MAAKTMKEKPSPVSSTGRLAWVLLGWAKSKALKTRLSVGDPIADFHITRQFGLMNGKKLIAFGWWTSAYVIVAGALFAFSAMSDCLQGAEGGACRARSSALTDWLLIIEMLGYAVLTWALFRRRR